MSQLFESLKIPMVKPKMEAKITPETATSNVLRTPMMAASKWVSVGVYEMNG